MGYRLTSLCNRGQEFQLLPRTHTLPRIFLQHIRFYTLIRVVIRNEKPYVGFFVPFVYCVSHKQRSGVLLYFVVEKI
jgi:hypothetical protein